MGFGKFLDSLAIGGLQGNKSVAKRKDKAKQDNKYDLKGGLCPPLLGFGDCHSDAPMVPFDPLVLGKLRSGATGSPALG